MKKNLLRNSILPYHVMSRSNNREWFYVPIEQVWEIMMIHAFTVTIVYGARIHAFVLMSNHFHCLVSTPDSNLDEIMRYFLREVGKEINLKSDRINHVFGGRYKWTLIQEPEHYAYALRYVYRNPVSAGICKHPEDYQFSTLSGLIGSGKLTLPLCMPIDFGKNDIDQMLDWVNQAPRGELEGRLVSAALRRTVFKIPKHLDGRKVYLAKAEKHTDFRDK